MSRIGYIVVFLLTASLLASQVEGRVPCARCPLCAVSSWTNWRCLIRREPSAHEVARCLTHELEDVEPVQKDAVQEIRQKLLRDVHGDTVATSSPTVFHFCGDNGVGKTHTAYAISRAMSIDFSSHASERDRGIGSKMRVIAANFAGMRTEDIRTNVVGVIVKHLRANPRGILLLDDIQDLAEEHFQFLKPLLTGEPFTDFPDVSTARATVIMTSDLGREGRTINRTRDEVIDMARESLADAFPGASTHRVTHVPFRPFDEKSARAMIRHLVNRAHCRQKNIIDASIDDDAVELLLRDLVSRRQLEKRNGRAVKDRVLEELDEKVTAFVVNHDGWLDEQVSVRVTVCTSGQSLCLSVVGRGETHEL